MWWSLSIVGMRHSKLTCECRKMLWWWFDTFEDDVDVVDGSSGMWLKTVFLSGKKNTIVSVKIWTFFKENRKKYFLRDRLVIGPEESRIRVDEDDENNVENCCVMKNWEIITKRPYQTQNEMEKPNIVEIFLLLSIWNALNTRFFGDRHESPAQHMVTLQARNDLKWNTLQFWIKVKVKTSSEKSQEKKIWCECRRMEMFKCGVIGNYIMEENELLKDSHLQVMEFGLIKWMEVWWD